MIIQKDYYATHRKNQTLPWVFASDKEKENVRMSNKDKEATFHKQVKDWEKDHNPVNAVPVF